MAARVQAFIIGQSRLRIRFVRRVSGDKTNFAICFGDSPHSEVTHPLRSILCSAG